MFGNRQGLQNLAKPNKLVSTAGPCLSEEDFRSFCFIRSCDNFKMNFMFPSPRYQVGSDFNLFVKEFESFWSCLDASDATKDFLLRFSIKLTVDSSFRHGRRKRMFVYGLAYNELISKAKEQAACPMSLHVIWQDFFNRIHVYGETVRSFIICFSSLSFPNALNFDVKTTFFVLL